MQSNRPLDPTGIALDQSTLPKPLNWQQLFNNTNPVELEIGIGKATFLTEQATSRPDTNFFGIEWANWFHRYAADRLRRHNCTNARTIRTEALFFLREHVPDNSITVLHVYFPDPWPKARHHKRRLIQEPFIDQAHRILIPNGRLQIVTDHTGYFEENIKPLLQAATQKGIFELVDYTRPQSAHQDEFVGTNFERKYKREGRPFHAIAAIKK